MPTSRLFSPLHLSCQRLLLVAGAFHILLVLAISLAGIYRVFPGTFNQEGVGISFAIDSIGYHREASEMAQLLQQDRLREWINYRSVFPTTLHIRLYSVGFALMGKLVGFRTLAAEPLNLFYYVSILLLTYAIGRDVFGPKVGKVAAIIVSIWPSLLLHTTQLLRDPLFISAFLLLVWTITLCIKRRLSFGKALAFGATAGFAVLVILLCRTDMKEILVVELLAAGTLCLWTQLREKRFLLPNICAIIIVTVLTVLIPKILPAGFSKQTRSTSPEITYQAQSVERYRDVSPLELFAQRVGILRHKFIVAYPLAGSNVDAHVEINTAADLLAYGPRAAAVGFFAPFPSMWFTRGVQVGMIGRLVSGAEMLAIYFLFLLAIVTLVRQRKRPAIWFLFIVTTLGCLALGYVVANISALYRMRYTFFILLLILGVEGIYIVCKASHGDSLTEGHTRD